MINYYIVYRCCNWACAYAKPINGRESLLSFAQVFAAAEPDFFFGGLLGFWSLLFLLHECYPQASAETVWIWSRGCA